MKSGEIFQWFFLIPHRARLSIDGSSSNGSTVANGSNRSSAVANGDSGSGVGDGDGRGGLGDGDWGSGSGVADVGNGLVDGVAGLLNDGGLNNLVDGVDLVGLGDGNWVGDLNGVGLGNMGLVDDLALNWDGVGDWDIDGNLVDLELGLDAGDLRSDLGVSANWGEDLLLGDGISGSWSKVAGSRGNDGSSWGWK